MTSETTPQFMRCSLLIAAAVSAVTSLAPLGTRLAFTLTAGPRAGGEAEPNCFPSSSQTAPEPSITSPPGLEDGTP